MALGRSFLLPHFGWFAEHCDWPLQWELTWCAVCGQLHMLLLDANIAYCVWMNGTVQIPFSIIIIATFWLVC